MSRHLSDYQKRRIRSADAETVGRLVHQENYWTPEALARILDRVDCRRQTSNSGSGFYSLTLVRGLLYHAEALLVAQKDEYRESIRLLRLAFKNLVDQFPNDAFFAAVDLVFFYTLTGREDLALKSCRDVLGLRDALTLRIHGQGFTVARVAVERGTMTPFQAIEIRTLLHVV